MKQSLQLRLGQQLTMTPQLQQAIRLLQLSTLDLRSEVQQILDSNPMLELEEGEAGGERSDDSWESGADSKDPAAEYNAQATGGTESVSDSEREAADQRVNGSEIQMEGIPEELPVDSSWEDVYYDAPVGSGGAASDDGHNFENQAGSNSESLRDHLVWQMQLTPFSERDIAIAEVLIDSINEDGYLGTTTEAIWESLKEELSDEGNELELDEVEMVLHRIQMFDPPGVAARDLRECLLLQLNQFDAQIPWLAETRLLVDQYLHLLGNRDYAQVMRRMKLTQDQLREVVEVIQSLNPRPGSAVAQSEAQYIVPDVIVKKAKGAWRVELNAEAVPRLRINSHYAHLVRRADNSSDNTYLKNNLQEARWFLKSLQSRNETLLKVATSIVERQRGFLEHGEEAMKALVLHDVAEAVGMHESTISRVTNQKYMYTPRGIFELKYFFSSHVTTATGGECSATAIRALIKKLVAAESPQKPLSDSKIASILGDQGINVARRTVAKYRESMSIPPSNERKRLA